MPRHRGKPSNRKSAPAKNAAQRQPKVWTAIPRSGVINAPPTGTAALTTVIARARRRMNQLLAITVGACTKPAVKESEKPPGETTRKGEEPFTQEKQMKPSPASSPAVNN